MLINAISNIYGPGTIAWGGSRIMSAPDQLRVAEVADALRTAGHPLAVGCATGADSAPLLTGAGAADIQVFAAFGPQGLGRGTWSNPALVNIHAAYGGQVHWWAGGGACMPIHVRLSDRTKAVARACTAGAILWHWYGLGRGTALLGAAVAARGLPVMSITFACGPDWPPSLGAGNWQLVADQWPVKVRVWVPDQSRLL